MLDPFGKFAVARSQFVGAFAQFAEQPRVLDRDDRLRREILQQRDLLVSEWANLLAINEKAAEQRSGPAQRHRDSAARATQIDDGAPLRLTAAISVLRPQVCDLDDVHVCEDAASAGPRSPGGLVV